MTETWASGNAAQETGAYGGWLLGHLVGPPDGVRATEDVEVRWGVNKAGEKRPGWSTGEQRTTLVLLVSGRFRLELTVGTVTLEKPGDYAVWGPGIEHYWEAEQDSVIVGIRWPAEPT
ncbi:MAG: hypothetical protein NVSMB13_01450 [Mycobacteriales bacterium]